MAAKCGMLLACLLLSLPAYAGEKAEVILRDGHTGIVEILATTPNSITVAFTKGKVTGETVINAVDLDPHSFYEIRRRTMEDTPENHVRLAIYCAESGLFNRAKRQMEIARALDPEIEEKIEKRPEIMEGIARRLLDSAHRHHHSGDLEIARGLALKIVTRFANTQAAAEALELRTALDKEIDKHDAAEAGRRKEKIAMAADEKSKLLAEKHEMVMKPLEEVQTRCRKAVQEALSTKNQSNAKRELDAAGRGLADLAKKIESELKTDSVKEDSDLVGMLTDLEKEVRSDGVGAFLAAGNIDLGMGNYNGATKYAREALSIDPDNAQAKSFLVSTQTAAQGDDDIGNIRRRRAIRRR